VTQNERCAIAERGNPSLFINEKRQKNRKCTVLYEYVYHESEGFILITKAVREAVRSVSTLLINHGRQVYTHNPANLMRTGWAIENLLYICGSAMGS
jgi:hypothetical protein